MSNPNASQAPKLTRAEAQTVGLLLAEHYDDLYSFSIRQAFPDDTNEHIGARASCGGLVFKGLLAYISSDSLAERQAGFEPRFKLDVGLAHAAYRRWCDDHDQVMP